jgi:hypothetical protein
VKPAGKLALPEQLLKTYIGSILTYMQSVQKEIANQLEFNSEDELNEALTHHITLLNSGLNRTVAAWVDLEASENGLQKKNDKNTIFQYVLKEAKNLVMNGDKTHISLNSTNMLRVMRTEMQPNCDSVTASVMPCFPTISEDKEGNLVYSVRFRPSSSSSSSSSLGNSSSSLSSSALSSSNSSKNNNPSSFHHHHHHHHHHGSNLLDSKSFSKERNSVDCNFLLPFKMRLKNETFGSEGKELDQEKFASYNHGDAHGQGDSMMRGGGDGMGADAALASASSATSANLAGAGYPGSSSSSAMLSSLSAAAALSSSSSSSSSSNRLPKSVEIHLEMEKLKRNRIPNIYRAFPLTTTTPADVTGASPADGSKMRHYALNAYEFILNRANFSRLHDPNYIAGYGNKSILQEYLAANVSSRTKGNHTPPFLTSLLISEMKSLIASVHKTWTRACKILTSFKPEENRVRTENALLEIARPMSWQRHESFSQHLMRLGKRYPIHTNILQVFFAINEVYGSKIQTFLPGFTPIIEKEMQFARVVTAGALRLFFAKKGCNENSMTRSILHRSLEPKSVKVTYMDLQRDGLINFSSTGEIRNAGNVIMIERTSLNSYAGAKGAEKVFTRFMGNKTFLFKTVPELITSQTTDQVQSCVSILKKPLVLYTKHTDTYETPIEEIVRNNNLEKIIELLDANIVSAKALAKYFYIALGYKPQKKKATTEEEEKEEEEGGVAFTQYLLPEKDVFMERLATEFYPHCVEDVFMRQLLEEGIGRYILPHLYETDKNGGNSLNDEAEERGEDYDNHDKDDDHLLFLY